MRRAYMQGEEFKTRQSAFAFFCARTLDYLTQFHADCMKGWKTLFRKTTKKMQTQLQLDFYGWWAIWTPERNNSLF